MKKLLTLSVLPLVLCSLALLTRADQSKNETVQRLNSAAQALREISAAPDRGIPDEVVSGAKCIAVVPSMIKGGFIVGGKHGRGVATCRQPDGSWSAPAFFVISGGSWGAQIGVEDVQFVMMIMNDEGVRNLLTDKFQIGGSASAAAGPVGRHASAGTDWRAETEILTYSRTHGLFAGIDLEGSWVERDKDSTVAFYGEPHSNRELLAGNVNPPPDARPFLNEVRRIKEVEAEKKGSGQ
jgi:SH3 domain-containing YSC84-like protein 1